MAFAQERTKIGEFVRANPRLLQPALEGVWRPKNTEDLAFATRRSVAKVGRILASAKVHNLDSRLRGVLIGGTVGEAFQRQYEAWEENLGLLPDPAKLLDGKEEWKHDALRPDQLRLVMRSCLSVLRQSTADQRRTRSVKMWGVLDRLLESDPMVIDLVQPIASSMIVGEAQKGLALYRTRQQRDAGQRVVSKLGLLVEGS